MEEWPEILSMVMVLAAATAAMVAWGWLISARVKKQPLLAYADRQVVPWGVIDLIAVVLLAIFIQGASFWVFQALGGTIQGASFESAGGMIVFSVASIMSWFAALSFITIRTGATLQDFGADKPDSSDITIGVIAFCLLLLPVFATQWALSQLWQESQHPLIDMLRERSDPLTFLASACAAVIVAPLVEEFFFRVLIQGWLEKIADLLSHRMHGDRIAPALANSVFLGTSRLLTNAGNSGVSIDDSPDDNPYSAAISGLESPPIEIATIADLQPSPAIWPVFVSATIFAVAHLGNGPDPIPLFLLALGLGFLYRQTHRVWPCIVVHMLLNGLSISQLWLMTQSFSM